MKSKTPKSKTGWQPRLLGLVLGLLLAAPAIAGGIQGEEWLEAKNADAMTLQLEGVLIWVTDDTRIYDGNGQRISFAQIRDPRQATSSVQYTGSRAARGVLATKLVVKLIPH
jgi:hypothetical protein